MYSVSNFTGICVTSLKIHTQRKLVCFYFLNKYATSQTKNKQIKYRKYFTVQRSYAQLANEPNIYISQIYILRNACITLLLHFNF